MPQRSGDTLVVAGVSVRALAESARQAGLQVIALDLFGDADTRAASARWAPIGLPDTLAIDGEALRRELAAVCSAGDPGVLGWVPGSGFEGAPDLLDSAPPGLPRLGMAAAEVRALRDAPQFFATLARLGLPHPPTQFRPPTNADGWLAKSSAGTGGWHIRRVTEAVVGAPGTYDPGTYDPGTYYQREQAGVPMSALFLADGQRAQVVALNRLLVRPLGRRPFVYRGAIGPIDDTALQAQVDAALALLVPHFALRGLASLDFIASDGQALWLEINPRPSASMVLHPDAWPAGLLAAHLAALQGRLPAPPTHPPGVRGTEVLYARRAGGLDASVVRALAAFGHTHDRPDAGIRFAAGEPVCSVSAAGDSVAAVELALGSRLAQVERLLTLPEETHP